MIFSEHFGKNCLILLQTAAKWRCIKLCSFSGPLCRADREFGCYGFEKL